jgi:hypothetical protein
VRGSRKNEERKVATKWRFCREKHVCVMWQSLFAGKNHGFVSIARSVCIMYRPVGIRTTGKTRKTKRITEHAICNLDLKGLKFLKNVHNQDVDILFYGRFVPQTHRPNNARVWSHYNRSHT